ncbi:disease resistance protein RPV1-like [Corylus avellana]|uniref:disease resistance protein RPV1-like n=1 Tax=Corylus avellana TaxID=13451 RepID=UPI00286CBD60|nr:disease resistance protein RPV1-like [Corylus avellana]
MAFKGASSSSSSSSSVTRQWAYDVFLSFRGEDTRNNFTAHLYAALDQKGINTYIDNDLERGENISPALLKAIDESRISVIVLSQKYASSSWCLDELATILECKKRKGQIVLPVFYKVDPSEVRHQKNNFGEAFARHEERFKDDQTKVQRWKTALTQVTNLSGCHLGNRNEHDFIQEIIEWVDLMLVKETYFHVAKYPVGIESRVQDVMLLLDLKKKDSTCMVGIVGTGGVGKTTLAKAIYNSIASQFEGSCFLENVRETSDQKGGLVYLQNKLLSKILGGSSQMVDNVDQGVTLIEKRLHLKMILLVFDDVDKLVQLEMLAGKTDWFGLGSRIIITTRDKHLLRAHDQVESIYLVNGLDHYEALRLFSWNAFKSDKPNDGYVEVTKDALRYCGRLPLALIVVGSTLKGRDIRYWKSKLDEYRRIPHCDIQEILRISFDGLDENAKNIFLDIAYFYKGKDVKYVQEMLDSCGFHSSTGIDELKDKCLITEGYRGSIKMHDLVQDMGREIVRQESPKNPGKHSRLWFHEDVRRVLEEDMGTNKVEGILIDLPELSQPIHLSPTAFERMKMLRIFINRNACFSEEPNFLSNELRLIDWVGYPGEYFPPNFRGEKLVNLRMVGGRIKTLEGVECFQSLTTMDFYSCEFLEKIPNISRIPNLELLKLCYCKNLVEVHHSVGSLNKLKNLTIFSCSNLRSFPKSFKSRSLEKIDFINFSMLKSFPKMECLEDIYCCDSLRALDWGSTSTLYYLNLSWCGIVTLSRCIESFVGLKVLKMVNCKQLQEILGLPPNVEVVTAWGCVSLEIFLEGSRKSQLFNTEDPPEPMGVGTEIPAQQSLRKINLSDSAIVSLPTFFNRFVKLEKLYLEGCKQLRKILVLPPNVRKLKAWNCSSLEVFLGEAGRSQFNTFVPPNPLWVGTASSALQPLEQKFQLECSFNSLEFLDLSGSAIVSLPIWFNKFVKLEKLKLNYCKQLRKILVLPPNVREVEASSCSSLEVFLGEARRSQLFNTFVPPNPLWVGTASSALQPLEQKFQLECSFNSLQFLSLCGSAIVSLPIWFNKSVKLEKLFLRNCKQLREVPELPRNIEIVDLGGCTSLERFPFNNIYDLPKLSWIDFSYCPEQIGNAVHNQLSSEGHPKFSGFPHFRCKYPGNRIPGCFNYCKEVSNTNLCEIDTGPLHFDSKNTIFAFSAVIGRRDHGKHQSTFYIQFEVFNNGQENRSNRAIMKRQTTRPDHVILIYKSYHSQLTTNNLRVKFGIYHRPPLVFFKSCAFHIIEQGYDDDDDDDYDDDYDYDYDYEECSNSDDDFDHNYNYDYESDWNPIEQR